MRKVLALSLALILTLGIMSHGTSAYFSDTETSAGNTLTAWVEEAYVKFYVCDHENYRIYKYDSAGAPAGVFYLFGGPMNPQGVATVGTDDVYVLDSGGNYVYHYTSGGVFLEMSVGLLPINASTGIVTNGLAIDGDELWTVSSNNIDPHQICCYSLSAAFAGGGDLTADMSITLDSENHYGTGLAIDDTYLYVVDLADLQVYRYERSTGDLNGISRVLREVDGSSLWQPRGVTVDDGFLWVVDCGTDKVYKYDKSALFEAGGPLNALWEFSLAFGNYWASGI